MSTRDELVRLEQSFAEAYARLTAVGAQLVDLRQSLDREANHAAPVLPSPPIPQPASPAPPAGGLPPIPAVPPVAPVAPVPPAAPGPPAPPVAAPHQRAPHLPPHAPPAPSPLPAPGAAPWPAGPNAAYGLPPRPLAPAAPRSHAGAITKVLAFAGALVTLIGITMLLVLAAQRGWFGPVARVTGGAIVALALMGIGTWLGERDRTRRTDHAVGAGPVALVATGAAAAYLDVMAMTTIYHWIPRVAGLALAGVVTLAGLLVGRRWRSQTLAVLLTLGAAFFGAIVAGGPVWLFPAFLVVLDAVAWVASRGSGWQWLPVARTLPAAIVLALSWGRPALTPWLVVVAVFTAVTLVSTIDEGRTDKRPVGLTFAHFIGTMGSLAALDALLPPARGWTRFALAALLLAVAAGLAKAPRLRVAPFAAYGIAVSGTIAAVVAVADLLPNRHLATGFFLLAAAYAVVSGALRSTVGVALGFLVASIGSLGYLPHLSVLLASPGNDPYAAGAWASLAGVLAVGSLLWALERLDVARVLPGVSVTALRYAALAAGLLMVGAGAVNAGAALGNRMGLLRGGFFAGHALSTVIWMATAAWLLVRGLERTKDSAVATRAGLVLSGVVVAKLFVHDLLALSGIWRSLAFIVTGLLLLAAGTGFAMAHDRKRKAEAAMAQPAMAHTGVPQPIPPQPAGPHTGVPQPIPPQPAAPHTGVFPGQPGGPSGV